MTLHVDGDHATIDDVSGDPADTVREVLAELRARGVTSVSVVLPAGDAEAARAWRRLGFAESRLELEASVSTLERQLAGGGESFGSVHAQTDDQDAVVRAVERFAPRLFRSDETVVAPAQGGWIGVYNAVAAREPGKLRRLAGELSHITGGVVVALGIERGEVVRSIVFERGRVMDEYLSLPEYYGPLPPGDAVALRINPVVLARLTGGDPDAIRRAGRSGSSPAELPPPRDHLAALADALGIADADAETEAVAARPGAVRVAHP